jgi:mono/diheme cytochrome c family protein
VLRRGRIVACEPEKLGPRPVVPRPLLGAGLAVMTLLAGEAASAENLDSGKSGARLFADSCATCHRSARELAKGRFRLTLFLFLQKHYATNSSSAWELSSYLESLDGAPRPRSRAAAAKPPPSGSPQSSLRPPLSVPQR